MVSRSPSKLGIFAKKEESVEFITRYRTVRVKLFDILLVNWSHYRTPAIIELCREIMTIDLIEAI